MKWTDIIGHKDGVAMLRHMESSRCMPHAVLFTGPAGIGKSVVAKVLATSLLCSASEGRPCGVCHSCQQVSYGTHPDFVAIFPDGANIKIEQIRNLQQEASLAPYVSQRRVCIIDGVELMTAQAANSLLRVLEEPTGEIVFILITANQQMLLSTIVSRCMSISFQPLAHALLIQELVDRGFLVEQAEVAARLSGGRIGIALAMLEPDGFALRNQAMEIVDDLLEGSMNKVWHRATLLEKMERSDILQIIRYFTYILRDTLLLVTGQGRQLLFNIDIENRLSEQANRWNEGQLVKAIGVVETARQAFSANANARLTSEALLIKMYDLAREV